MARMVTLSDEDLIRKEEVKIKTETGEVCDSDAYDTDRVNSDLFGADIKIKVELETDDNSIDKTEFIVKDENAGELSENYFKVEPGNYEQVGLQYFDFIKAFKTETVIKEEIFSEIDLNNKSILKINKDQQGESFNEKVNDNCCKVYSKEDTLFSDKCDEPPRDENSKIKPYSCDICGKGFGHAYNLKRHKRMHTGEKSYFCDTCGKGFAVLTHLKDHKRIHTGEKPFYCDTCGQSFRQASGLKVHTRMHTGEKPLSCDTCGKEFGHASHLKRHKRMHTGEKPFSCETCGKAFAEASNLKKHSNRIHKGEKPYRKPLSITHKLHLRIHDEESYIPKINQNIEINPSEVAGLIPTTSSKESSEYNRSSTSINMKAFEDNGIPTFVPCLTETVVSWYSSKEKSFRRNQTSNKSLCVLKPRTFRLHEYRNSTPTKKTQDDETNPFLKHQLSPQCQFKDEKLSITTFNKNEYHDSSMIDQKSNMDTNYNNLKLKRKTGLLKQETPEKMSFFEIQIPENDIKQELPEDKMDNYIYLAPEFKQILCDKVDSENDDYVAFKSEVVVQKDS